MEGSISGSVTEAAGNLADAANKFVDEAQQFAGAGVDLTQEAASELVHTAIGAVETVLAGLKSLVSRA